LPGLFFFALRGLSSSMPEQNPQIAFAVEVGPQNRPIMKVRVKEQEIPLGLTAAQAGELGRALLAASAVCSSSAPPPAGTRLTNCHFPVLKGATGRSHANGLPLLIVEVMGGTQLALQFGPRSAEECATSLAAAAANGGGTDVPQRRRDGEGT
jgi:hypothetical protein